MLFLGGQTSACAIPWLDFASSASLSLGSGVHEAMVWESGGSTDCCRHCLTEIVGSIAEKCLSRSHQEPPEQVNWSEWGFRHFEGMVELPPQFGVNLFVSQVGVGVRCCKARCIYYWNLSQMNIE